MSDTESRNSTTSGSLDSLADILNNLNSDDEDNKTVDNNNSDNKNIKIENDDKNQQQSNLKTVSSLEDEDSSLDNEDSNLEDYDSNLKDEDKITEQIIGKKKEEDSFQTTENSEKVQQRSVLVTDSSRKGKYNLAGATEDETEDTVESTQNKTIKNHSADYSESSVIEQFLGHCNDDAEARLLARRQARAEARDIRMRELERQQREQEENADRQYDMLEQTTRAARTVGSRYLSSRRSSEDSLEDGGSIREIRHELKEMEEKFRKAMIANAQLDNDKASQTYQLELLKDRLEELEEEHSQLRREHRDKCREHDQLKRLAARLKDDLAVTRAELEERDRLIAEKGLVIVVEDIIPYEEDGVGDAGNNGINSITPKKALVSSENAQLLENAGEGSLDVRLSRFASEKKDLQDQISHLRLELEEEKSKKRKTSGVTLNGPTSHADYEADDVQKDVVGQLADFKFRAQKAEQDVATLQATFARLESQVIRYKSAAEMYEKSEEALKQEKRKLQREAREAQNRAEELETSNTHLLKRLDKLKNAKSTLLKEL